MKLFQYIFVFSLCYGIAYAVIPAAFLAVGAIGTAGSGAGAALKAIGEVLNKFNEESYVRITNTMGKDVEVTANCASGDDKIGEYKLKDGEGFAWKFKQHIGGKTLFFCDVTTSDGKTKHWDVYKGHEDSKNWFLRGDGIYTGEADESKLEKKHDW